MKVPEAWAQAKSVCCPAEGAGILVAQPATGIASHRLLDGAVDWVRVVNLVEIAETGPGDPMSFGLPKPPVDPRTHPGNPGHGTAVCGVLASRGKNADRRFAE
ncbi:MAG: hypothetical protein GC191_16020 [Azospirillum sp.]|nr:hypothetical protein [Azospirillum sp.]